MTDERETISAWVEREREASLHAFALDFRKRVGRPFGAAEWGLVQLAHSAGWFDGLDAALRDCEAGHGQEDE